MSFLPNISAFLSSWGLLAAITVFIVTLAAIPVVITLLPCDYFLQTKRAVSKQQVSFMRLLLTFVKNIFGVLLIVAGIVMLVLPGQGLLTILLGLMLTDFPGKYALEKKLVQVNSVFRSINWIRRKAGKEPMLLPAQDA